MSAVEHRALLSDTLFNVLSEVEGVFSVTLVGSAGERDDLSSVADIDTIVICQKLTKAVFDGCVERVEALTAEDIGFEGRELKVNSTFGPLKFDSESEVVVHLMIYDVAGHRQHVLKSPFTCYDWERSSLRRGPSLADIYPVLKLQPRDFLRARRGLTDYLKDLESGVLSYRRYEFYGDNVSEVTEQAPLNERHKGEYGYHIIKNLVANYVKMVTGQNLDPNDGDLIDNWRTHLPGCSGFIEIFQQLESAKRDGTHMFPPDTVEQVRAFLGQFEEEFSALWAACPRASFIRHGRTELNDGSFLGQGRDPGLAADVKIDPSGDSFDAVYVSQLRRTVETAAMLVTGREPIADQRLAEIEYGEAEGLLYRDMCEKFPELVEAWKRGEDVRFPGGENSEDVLGRLKAFAEERLGVGSNLVVTHNVVLRCLAGWLYGIPMADWFKLVVPHVQIMNIACRDGRFYPDLSPDVRGLLIDGLVGYKAAE